MFDVICLLKEKLQAMLLQNWVRKPARLASKNINFGAKSVPSLSHFFVAQPTGKLGNFVNTYQNCKTNKTSGGRERESQTKDLLDAESLDRDKSRPLSSLIPITLWDHIRRSNSNLGNLNFIVFVWSSVSRSIQISVCLTSSIEFRTLKHSSPYQRFSHISGKIKSTRKFVLQDILYFFCESMELWHDLLQELAPRCDKVWGNKY